MLHLVVKFAKWATENSIWSFHVGVALLQPILFSLSLFKNPNPSAWEIVVGGCLFPWIACLYILLGRLGYFYIRHKFLRYTGGKTLSQESVDDWLSSLAHLFLASCQAESEHGVELYGREVKERKRDFWLFQNAASLIGFKVHPKVEDYERMYKEVFSWDSEKEVAS